MEPGPSSRHPLNEPMHMTSQQMEMYFGFAEDKAKETARNPKMSKYLLEIWKEYRAQGNFEPPNKKIANLLYILASKLTTSTDKYIQMLVEYVLAQKIDTEPRITAALKYLLEHLRDVHFSVENFDKACGIGIVVTHSDMEAAVKIAVEHFKSEIIEKRYRINIGLILAYIRKLPKMDWADGMKLKIEAEQQIIVLLGPKTDEDRQPLPPSKKSDVDKLKGVSSSRMNNASKAGSAKSVVPEEPLTPQQKIVKILKKLPFHKAGDNFMAEGYPCSDLSMELLRKHLKKTGGQVRTRFPPEPNGILHIGHAKAININFGYAKAYGGVCYLRYDDTNPEKEEERFFLSIREMVEWLEYAPYQVTHASDYFEELYQFAVVLIKKKLAYVCHQTPEEMKGFTPVESQWRSRQVDTNLALFEGMKNGKFDEGECTLRMKVTLEEGKQDPVAYRIRYTPHPRTGKKWCIYPTYDFTHCLCDSLENITHSLCTKEFQNRRSSYYWLCESVETYVPVQWEYGRLNMCYTVVSKRKIAKLIEEGIVADWDDPRLYTLPALRRRGFPSEAVNDFCVRMGVTGATIMVEPAMLDACVRDVLNVSAPRTMVVMDPVKVTIENFPFSDHHSIQVPDYPTVPDSKTHKVALRRVIFIERSDYREYADKGYKRFAKNQPVGLRHAGLVISCKQVITDKKGHVTEIIALCSKGEHAAKPKGFIHWVSDPMKIEVRLYDRLFNHKNPEDPIEAPLGFVSDCNRDSLHKVEAYADGYFEGSDVFSAFQFERVGFFSIDPDTNEDRWVFNRTVTLKEDNEKN